MPPAAASKGEMTRRAILDAAIVRFGRQGYRNTSVAEIARDAGVGGTVAYTYFANKEALFFAALDEDAAAVIHEGIPGFESGKDLVGWRQTLILTLLDAVDRHPLARRALAGLEPDVIERLVELPAVTEMRKACAELLRAEQLAGNVRTDIDPVAVGSGVVTITISLVMSLVQLGRSPVALFGRDVDSVFDAALGPMTGPPPLPAPYDKR